MGRSGLCIEIHTYIWYANSATALIVLVLRWCCLSCQLVFSVLLRPHCGGLRIAWAWIMSEATAVFRRGRPRGLADSLAEFVTEAAWLVSEPVYNSQSTRSGLDAERRQE
jgi:hypothetical protein